MIKHPALRLADIADADPKFLDELQVDLLEFQGLCPFGDLIQDYEISGSYAAGRAKLHSDLDINLALGTPERMVEARNRIKQNKAAWDAAFKFIHNLSKKYGTLLQIQIQFPTMKAQAHVMCYSLLGRKTYGTVKKRQLPKITAGVFDETTGEFVELVPGVNDPFLKEIPKYKKLYGAKYLEYGETPETAHMKPR